MRADARSAELTGEERRGNSPTRAALAHERTDGVWLSVKQGGTASLRPWMPYGVRGRFLFRGRDVCGPFGRNINGTLQSAGNRKEMAEEMGGGAGLQDGG